MKNNSTTITLAILCVMFFGVLYVSTPDMHKLQSHHGESTQTQIAYQSVVFTRFESIPAPLIELAHSWYTQRLQNVPQSLPSASTGQIATVAASLPVNVVQAPPIIMAGAGAYAAFVTNIRVALDANNGAIRNVVIPPGGTWSFNEAMGNPANIPYVAAYGVPGGGWCDLAGRYRYVARQMLPPTSIESMSHGIQLANLDWQDSITIWNVGGARGGQDLVLHNTTQQTIHIEAVDKDGMTVIEGYTQ